MKEEEVDQYFKNKFNQFTPAPSADAWARLQSKLEPPQQNRPVMWVYYAAAVVTLVVVSGAFIFWLEVGQLNTNENIAQLKPVTTPLRVNPTEPATVAAADAKAWSLPQNVEPQLNEKEVKNTATTNTITSKPIKKARKLRPRILIATRTVKSRKNAAVTIPSVSTPETTSLAAAANPPVSTTPPATEESIMEVIIKKAPVNTATYAQNTDYPTAEEAIKENLSRKGRLVRNIFKQARNLKNGDKVELSTLGLNANYRIDVESKLLKQKYTKVINL